jgi:phenylpropionate dioxygenase-like ring-hydroxylating dioxygenase large terminal subunit
MAPSMLNYLGFGGPSLPAKDQTTTSQTPSPIKALPANWYTSPQMYQLERRAIFSQKWQLITHSMRLPTAGSWLKFSIAGYEFIIAKDRKDTIHALHNVCRHRAFPVVPGESGTAKIFSCKYHGWSYGLDGKLAKAPKYDELSGFDKEANGLFPIHVHIDVNGFIWVNLDGNKEPLPWEAEFANIDTQERFKPFNFDDYYLDHEYQMEGKYNWKILADNFNECYHCPTTHPDVPTLADIETHAVDTDDKCGWIKHQSKLTEAQKRDGLGIASTYYFPNVSLSVL